MTEAGPNDKVRDSESGGALSQAGWKTWLYGPLEHKAWKPNDLERVR
jgi:hypothetical protein